MKKFLVLLGLVLVGFQTSMAQKVDDFGIFQHFGANVGVGTEGISIGVATPITNYLEASFGVNFMPGIKVDGDVNIGVIDTPVGFQIPASKVNIQGNFARTTLDFKVSAYPFGLKNAFFVTAGFSFGGKAIADLSGHNDVIQEYLQKYPQLRGQITAEIDKYNIKFDDNGNVEGDVRVNSFRPYLGLGYGRLVPKGRVGFRVEAGVQFMGKMKVYQNDTEVPLQENLNADDDLSKIIDKWKVYPVLKFMLTTRIL